MAGKSDQIWSEETPPSFSHHLFSLAIKGVAGTGTFLEKKDFRGNSLKMNQGRFRLNIRIFFSLKGLVKH